MPIETIKDFIIELLIKSYSWCKKLYSVEDN